MRIMAKYGFKIVATWESKKGRRAVEPDGISRPDVNGALTKIIDYYSLISISRTIPTSA